MTQYQRRDLSTAYHNRYLERNPERRVWRSMMTTVRSRGLDCDIDLAWIQERIVRGKCEVTGLPFSYKMGTHAERNPYMPSIDRRDPRRGYLKDNCRLVVAGYNAAKHTWDDETTYLIAKATVTARERQAIPGGPAA